MWVDFNRYGHASTVTAQLSVEEREGLHLGETVMAAGDSVAARRAVVVWLSPDRSEATLEFE